MSEYLTPEQLKNAAETFFYAQRTITEAREAIEAAKNKERDAHSTVIKLKTLLAEQVQPMCGSATLPNRRVILMPDSKHVVVLNWDHANDQRGGASVTVETLVKGG